MREAALDPAPAARAPSSCPSETLYSIADAERATGIAKETLRVWERRYGFPSPQRDGHGDRLYSREQVEQLQVVKRALALGHRPGAVLGRPPLEWHRLATTVPNAHPPQAQTAQAFEAHWLSLLRQRDTSQLRRAMRRELERRGLRDFVVAGLAPAMQGLGDAWHRGDVAIFEEHLFTQVVSEVLREAISNATPGVDVGPRVLLTTLPGEQHVLGLLMVEALLTLEGAACQTLGAETPLDNIVAAVEAMRIDVVALSCSPCVAASRLVGDLKRLRAMLPDSVEIWAGGSAPALRRRRLGAVRVFQRLEPVAEAVGEWCRERQA